MFSSSLIRAASNVLKTCPKFLRVNQIHSENVLFKAKTEDFINLIIRGESLQFPNVWLRDNCQCEKCFHYSAKSRILDWSKFDLDIKPKDVCKGENSLRVTWTDGHTSVYNYDWLKFRSFTADHQKAYTEMIYKPNKTIWHGKDFNEICKKHDYNDVTNSDDALYDWLHNLSVYGVALIQNTPNLETAIDAVVERIGFTKRTHYGVKFIVQNVQNTSNVAYLSSNLQMHTDLPYYDYVPGANLLHCLVQTASKGGENLLSDCHYTAAYLKEHHPDKYHLLSNMEVEWKDVGTENGHEFFKLHRSPVICLDMHKEITRINFSVPQRGSQFPGPIELVKPWYEAWSLFLELNHTFSAKFKTSEGDILVFDNTRLLHGRNAYEDSCSNVRKIIGAYVDWDEIYSRLRCLKVKLNNEQHICL